MRPTSMLIVISQITYILPIRIRANPWSQMQNRDLQQILNVKLRLLGQRSVLTLSSPYTATLNVCFFVVKAYRRDLGYYSVNK